MFEMQNESVEHNIKNKSLLKRFEKTIDD